MAVLVKADKKSRTILLLWTYFFISYKNNDNWKKNPIQDNNLNLKW